MIVEFPAQQHKAHSSGHIDLCVCVRVGVYTCVSLTILLLPSVTRKTRCSAIAERPRCRVRYSFRQK